MIAEVQTLFTFYTPYWGNITYLKIYTPDYCQLTWEDIWNNYSSVYPNRWAIEFFPPKQYLVNEENVYHLWMFDEHWQPPQSDMNLAMKYA